MNVSVSAWLVIALAIVAANLPFLNDKLFCVVKIRWRTQSDSSFAPRKPLIVRIVELAVFYFLIGGIAYSFESTVGNHFQQRWEFYAVTVFLFIVFAYPGFVFQYLRKRRG